jgi:hypothetical protein
MYIPAGLITALVVGWVIWWFFSSLDEWLSGRREFKEMDRQNEEFNKHHHYDDNRQRWVRNVDGAALYEYGYSPPAKENEDQV